MIKILIVDDDQMNCDLLQNVFTRHGYQVISTTSGREGLSLFRTDAPSRGPIQLRQNQSSDAHRLVKLAGLSQRVLPDCGVQHQEHLVRRAR